MNLRSELLAGHSKDRATSVADFVGDDDERFAELMRLMTSPEYRLSQRASWPVSICVERFPRLIEPHYKSLIKLLAADDSHPAVRRNVVRLLQFVEIPGRWSGRIFDACWRLIDNPKEAIAVRCFALTVAGNIAQGSPELLDELRLLAVKYPQAATAGFRSRTRRLFGV